MRGRIVLLGRGGGQRGRRTKEVNKGYKLRERKK